MTMMVQEVSSFSNLVDFENLGGEEEINLDR